MRALIQRVSKAKVTVDSDTVGEINKGILVLLGITHEDSEKDVDYLVEKIVNLRIFPDKSDHFDLSVTDVGGEILVVSQFTLYGSTKKGRRPAFNDSANPEIAEPLYNLFIDKMRKTGLNTSTGRFGAMMEVELINSGPVTFLLES